MPYHPLTPRFLLLLCLCSPAAVAQTFSYDGNRWYEIEVSIFSNSASVGTHELVIPDKVTLAYPEPIRQLVPAVSSFMVDFDEEAETAANAANLFFPGEETANIGEAEPAPGSVMIGPRPKPPASDFELTDFSRDPYIALGDDEAEFRNYNRDIARSPEHRLLFHAVWRQPVFNLAQATAIFVAGGDQYGLHHELEGSLRFSFNVNRVDVEANLWLAGFSAFPAASGNSGQWQLPKPPFQTGDDNLTLELPVTRLGYMKQVRQMVSNELHYLDHPDMGMLVEIRPYELPQPAGFSFE